MITIRRGLRDIEGSCNACSRTDHSRYRIVWIIELALQTNGISFRLCSRCKKELWKELGLK